MNSHFVDSSAKALEMDKKASLLGMWTCLVRSGLCVVWVHLYAWFDHVRTCHIRYAQRPCWSLCGRWLCARFVLCSSDFISVPLLLCDIFLVTNTVLSTSPLLCLCVLESHFSATLYGYTRIRSQKEVGKAVCICGWYWLVPIWLCYICSLVFIFNSPFHLPAVSGSFLSFLFYIVNLCS